MSTDIVDNLAYLLLLAEGIDQESIIAVGDDEIFQSGCDDDFVAIGEVGLTGEIRAVSHLTQRLGEGSRLGFQKCMIPRSGSEKVEIPQGLTVYRVRNLREAIETAL